MAYNARFKELRDNFRSTNWDSHLCNLASTQSFMKDRSGHALGVRWKSLKPLVDCTLGSDSERMAANWAERVYICNLGDSTKFKSIFHLFVCLLMETGKGLPP
jgi:hypothetical protein